jgi:gag-polypeptide of LTR copia-type/Zinc knuckle
MSTTPVLLNSRDHGYITVAPRFELDDFSSWKDRMLLHLVGIEPYLIDVLTKGPYVPQAPFTGPALANEGEVQMVDKPEAQWTDDERKLVNLDNKLRGIIISTLPTNIMKTVIKLTSAKLVWDTLCIQFEGTEEVRANKKIDLKRSYETFFAKPSESLSDTYNRFKCLLDDMTNVDIIMDAYELNHKFLDILPYKWQGLRQILRNNGSLKTHSLQSLYGVFQFEEKAAAQVKRAEADSRRNDVSTPSGASSSNASSSTSLALISAENIDITSKDVREADEATLNSIVNFASSLDPEERNDLVNEFMEFALVAGSKYAKKWRKTGPGFKSTGGFDKSQETCYKCGKKGHYQKECRSAPMANQKEGDSTYKSKYYKLKAQIATTSEPTEKGFVAEEKDWADSDDSSDDEVITQMCFMATSDETAVNKDQVANGQWVFVTLKKVTTFSESPADIQKGIYESLMCDFQFVEQTRADLVKKLQTAEDCFISNSAQLKELKDIHKTLKLKFMLTQ